MKPKVWWVAIAVFASFWVLPSGAMARNQARALERRAEADALFTNGVATVLRLDLSARAIASLRVRPRRDVVGTVREYAPTDLQHPVRVYTNVQVHLKGHWGSFRQIDDKPGFTLKLGDTNGTFHGLKKFHLNNSVQDGTYLSEWLCAGLFRSAGVPMPRAAHACVELNGRRLGLYVLKEGINRDFLEQFYQDGRGNVYGQSEPADVNAPLQRMGGREADTNRLDLRRLTQACVQSDPLAAQERLSQVLDVDEFLSFMALEMMVCDWDGYTIKSHNYRVYHNVDEDKMVFIPHDKDQILANPNFRVEPKQPGGLVARSRAACA